MTARIAVATALRSPISSSAVRALNGCLMETSSAQALLKCRGGLRSNSRNTKRFRIAGPTL